MKSLKRNFELFKIGVELSLRRLLYFRISTLFNVLGNALFLIVNILFWKIIYTNIEVFNGWTLEQMYLFTAFSEFFHIFTMIFFPVAGKLWKFIYTGKLDTYLTKPLEPYVLINILYIRLENIFNAIPSIIWIIIIINFYKIKLDVISFFIALLFNFVAVFIYSLIQMSTSTVSFWFGKISAIDELSDSLAMLVNYPHTIFPFFIRVFMITLLPFGYASTVPAFVTLKMNYIGTFWALLLGAVFSIMMWIAIFKILWKLGMKRYESYGG
ncbi:ABC transporter permease [Thermosipho globiformans]|uniref:ABC transporter permease n=1 Tax=Thermosipho globiformans TaxID=380685 RepID=UPI000F8C3B97|nr:ABC-2 family transporter protein [Thermosipho globiformans]